MRISRVEIANFLCFRRVDVGIHPTLQILAGPNNSGKSSFIRLLEAFFSGFDGRSRQSLQPRNAYFKDGGRRTLSTVKVSFTDLDGDEHAECKDAVRKDGTLSVTLRCSRAGVLSWECSGGVKGDAAKRIYDYVVDRHHFVKVPSVRVGGAGDQEKPESLERLLDTLEALLIRRGVGRATTTQRDFDERAKALEDVVSHVLDESAKSIHSELPFRDGEVRFRLPDFRFALRGMLEAVEIESVGGVTIPVSERGTGFQSALVLGILRYVAAQERSAPGRVLFAVEEPEAFLHPQTQRAMAAILRSIAADAQLVVTTHSSVVVDAFNVEQIARLPLMPDGSLFSWRPPQLKEAEAGRLNRYCDAANSELVFATSVVLVEGEGDARLVEWLLEEMCETPGGHYARGISVIDVGGKGNFQYFVELCALFGVRPYLLADKDALLGSRELLGALRKGRTPPSGDDLAKLRANADHECLSYEEARRQQALLNGGLAGSGAFVLSSDLEGAIVDGFSAETIAELKAGDGATVIPEEVAANSAASSTPAEVIAAWAGSKRWNGREKPSGKAKPHWPRLVVQAAADSEVAWPEEVEDLRGWLAQVIGGAETPQL